MIPWELVKQKVFIPADRPLRLFPITADLDRYEAETGFALPKSFREFALTFGAGTIVPDGWEFAVPGFPVANRFADEFADPGALTQWLHNCWGPHEFIDDDEKLGETMGMDDPVRARRLVLFCTNGADFFGWDPLDVTDPNTREYGIFMIGRDDTRIMRLATRFQRFVLTYCFRGMIDVGETGLAEETDSERCEFLEYLVTMAAPIDEDNPLGFYPSIH